MRYEPRLYELPQTRQTLEVFGGYDRRERASEGAFRDMENMTSDHYPLLASRGRRGVSGVATGGLIAKDSLCRIDGVNFVMDGYPIDLGLTPGQKQLVSMGAYVIILPDKKYINTADISDRGEIEATYTSQSAVQLSLCMASGDPYDRLVISDQAPEDPADADYWLDTSGKLHSLKCYSKSREEWTSVVATYVKLSCPGIGRAFAKFDGVQVSGILDAPELNGAAVIWEKGEDHVVIAGLLDRVITQEADQGSILITRRLPEMDFVIESENRLWGCRYGLSADGQVVNELYASKLGDFRNWQCFMGLSTDSYAVSCGTDGPFTGAITHMGYPLFFKENCVHKVYGSVPADFRVQTTACRGVQKGSHRSLALVGEQLFYKSPTGVCVYDGALPVDIGAPLGREYRHSAVGGSWGEKYYLSVLDEEDQPSLLVYDRAVGLWHREDALRIASFCACRGRLYAQEEGSGRVLTLVGGDGDEVVTWSVTTGPLGLRLPEQKYVSRLLLRLQLEHGARLSVSVCYEDAWEEQFFLEGKGLRSYQIPLRLRRCDHVRLRLQGRGGMKLFSLTKTIEQGSEQP